MLSLIVQPNHSWSVPHRAHTRVCPDSALQRKMGAPHGASPNHRLRALSLLARFLDIGEQYIDMVRRVPVPIPNPLPRTVRPMGVASRSESNGEQRLCRRFFNYLPITNLLLLRIFIIPSVACRDWFSHPATDSLCRLSFEEWGFLYNFSIYFFFWGM